MRRRNILVKFIIFGTLLAFTPVVVFFRWWRKSLASYRYCDAPGMNIPLPDEVRGQRGFNVCISNDGRKLAVAGNALIPQDILEFKKEVILRMWVLKYSLHIASTDDYKFKQVHYSHHPGIVVDMALSPATPDLLAFLVAESPLVLPETMEEITKIIKDPTKRERLAKEYAEGYWLKKHRITVYTQDVGANQSPSKLCTLDVSPDNAPSDLQPKSLDERLMREKQKGALAWSSAGDALFTSNGFSITKIDLNGNKKMFYDPHPGGTYHILSNICCCPNGEILLLEAEGKEFEDFSTRLIRLDKDGKVLSQNKVSKFYGGLQPFDESLPALIDSSRMVCTGVSAANYHESILNVVSFPPYADDWHKRSTKQVFNDPNDVFFGYRSRAFVPGKDELLVLKWRVCWTYKNALTKETPWSIENAAAPWGELRRVKIG